MIWDFIKSWMQRPWVSVTIRFFWTGDNEVIPNARFKTPQEFSEYLRPHALRIEEATGIPWLFCASQAAHESTYGNSELAQRATNLFGVTGDDTLSKAGVKGTLPMSDLKTWLATHPEVPVLVMRTNEFSTYPPEQIRHWVRPGDIVSKTPRRTGTDLVVERPFRRYSDLDECLSAWADLLGHPRYAKALIAAKIGDFAGFAQGLKDGGYATDQKYVIDLEQMHAVLDVA